MLIVSACPQKVLIPYSLSLHFIRPGEVTEVYQMALIHYV